MTRLLSDLLGLTPLDFSQRVRQLEHASGEPGTDIRLSTDILQRAQTKLRDLGLDPRDTTAPELYHALQERLLADEGRLRERMGLPDATSADVLSGLLQFEAKLDLPRSSFALKASTVKRMLKKQPPKKAMVQLGYRSLDSLIKHEQVAYIYVASALYENDQWHRNFLQQYDRLRPSDFETREAAVLLPRSARWEKLAKAFADKFQHTSMVLRELGTIVVLPVHADVPALGLVSLLTILDGLNVIRCASSYMKMQQVNVDFGARIRQVAAGELTTPVDFAGQSLPWQLVQYYYHKVREAYHPALFEPHVQPEDLELVEAEAALAQAVPALSFWEDTAGLAHVHEGQVVSLNMLDVALGAANNLTFEQRITKHVRQHVWGDIIVNYLRHHQSDFIAEQLQTSELDMLPAEAGAFA